MTHLTLTQAQAERIAARYNGLVRADYHIGPGDVAAVMPDNAAADMMGDGQAKIDIAAHKTLTGKPAAVLVAIEHVTINGAAESLGEYGMLAIVSTIARYWNAAHKPHLALPELQAEKKITHILCGGKIQFERVGYLEFCVFSDVSCDGGVHTFRVYNDGIFEISGKAGDTPKFLDAKKGGAS